MSKTTKNVMLAHARIDVCFELSELSDDAIDTCNILCDSLAADLLDVVQLIVERGDCVCCIDDTIRCDDCFPHLMWVLLKYSVDDRELLRFE